MSETFSLAPLVGFLLALIRVSSWMLLCPPFNTRMLPRRVKIGVASALALPIASQLPAEQATFAPYALAGQAVAQMATGMVLGLFCLVVFSVFQAAGSYVDMFGGFSMSSAMDPLLNNQSSVFGRFYQLLGTTLLLVTNGHLIMIKGFMTSFKAVPLSGPTFDGFTQLLVNDLAYFGIASIEIVGPLLAAYMLTEVGIGFLNKAAPQLNVLMFGFPLKILLTIVMVALTFPLLSTGLGNVLTHIMSTGSKLLGVIALGGG